jgi:hypothetical protein
MEPIWPLGIGGRLEIEGRRITVSAVEGAEVQGLTEAGERVCFALTPVAVPERPEPERDEEWRFGSTALEAGALSDTQLREAAAILGHLNEAYFGYRSGDPGRPSAGEPRPAYDPALTTRTRRLEAKAAELGCSVETLRRRRRSLSRRGIAGLLDGRGGLRADADVDTRLREAILVEAADLAEASDVRKMQFRNRVAARLARESGGPLELPSTRQTFNRIVEEVLGQSGLFRRPAKARRSAAGGPSEDFGSLLADRQGACSDGTPRGQDQTDAPTRRMK